MKGWWNTMFFLLLSDFINIGYHLKEQIRNIQILSMILKLGEKTLKIGRQTHDLAFKVANDWAPWHISGPNDPNLDTLAYKCLLQQSRLFSVTEGQRAF